MARGDGNPVPPVADLSDLLGTPRERGSRYVRFGVFAGLVAGLVVALVVLLPPLIHPRGTQAGAPGEGPPPPPGGCAPPIGPPPDVPLNPLGGGPPHPPPGVPGPGEPCPGPPSGGPGFRLVSTNQRVDVTADNCRTRIDLDTVAITSVAADADLDYQPCGPRAVLRSAGRPFGDDGTPYASTGKDCQTKATDQRLPDVRVYAPNLAGYCVVLPDKRVVHVLVQAWGNADRPNLRLQITTWEPAGTQAT